MSDVLRLWMMNDHVNHEDQQSKQESNLIVAFFGKKINSHYFTFLHYECLFFVSYHDEKYFFDTLKAVFLKKWICF